MTADFHTIEARGISVTLDLRVGHVRDLAVAHDGRKLRPLHTAPWVDDPAVTADAAILPNLRSLSGDFFCAPFGAADVEPAPSHGWTANSRWEHAATAEGADGVTATYRLARTVMGARVAKVFTLRHGHPFLYQRHVFDGGGGAVPVANHAMTRFAAGGRLTFSAKRWAETPARALEPDPSRGRSALLYPSGRADPARMPLARGGTADITRYPFAERHEDFVVLAEAPGSQLGWFAAHRADRADAVLSLKRPVDFPLTLLWFSNGGRDYPPWNGRHVGVLGIEEARSFAGYGHRASIEPNRLSDENIPTSLSLGPGLRAELRNVVGGVPWPADAAPIEDVRATGDGLALAGRGGAGLAVPFDAAFLHGNG